VGGGCEVVGVGGLQRRFFLLIFAGLGQWKRRGRLGS